MINVMADTEDLEDQLADIDDAILYVIKNGQTRTIRDKTVTYPKLSEMQAQRDILARKINRSLPTSTLIRRRRA